MFDSKNIQLPLQDADISYFPNFFETEAASNFYKNILENTSWQHDKIRLFGKSHLQPRLTALFANNNKPYSYSNIIMQPTAFTETLLSIKQAVEIPSAVRFTSCLANLYRDGRDSNGWHADNEKALGEQPVIASVSLGQARFFHLKHRTHKTERHKLLLEHGSLLIMRGSTQSHWMHQIAKTARKIEPRINLTFRVIR